MLFFLILNFFTKTNVTYTKKNATGTTTTKSSLKNRENPNNFKYDDVMSDFHVFLPEFLLLMSWNKYSTKNKTTRIQKKLF